MPDASTSGALVVGPVLERLNGILLGKETSVKLAVAGLLARGHLLLEDVPGVGKTTLARALARVLGLEYQRAQFTADLLPADLLGVSVYERDSHDFRFHPGPIFTEVLLADEINRAGPKTQSALLEAMEERQVSLDGRTRALPDPFFVIATQNPAQQVGVFPLPESQLDRFLMRLSFGYPSRTAEKQLLLGGDTRVRLESVLPVTDSAGLKVMQAAVAEVRVTPALVDYLLALLEASRRAPGVRLGLSPRAGLALKQAAQAWAYIEGRRGVLPEDVQAVFPAIAGHRLIGPEDGAAAARAILMAVPVP